jgi:hypothetical protein
MWRNENYQESSQYSFDGDVAAAMTDQLHSLWAQYTADKAQINEMPTFVDFFTWVLYTKGWEDRGRFEEYTKSGHANIDDGPRHWLGPTR